MMRSASNWLVAISLAAILYGCTTYAGTKIPDDVTKETLVGTWQQLNQNTTGAVRETTFVFYRDGTYRAASKVVYKEARYEYENHGRWEVAEGVVYLTVTQSTRADVPIGIRTPNRIVELTESEVTAESENGIRTTAYRIR